ncbi:hypothetical protein D3C84_419500 [compost metagenome]
MGWFLKEEGGDGKGRGSVDDKEAGALLGVRAMGLGVVRHLIAHARRQGEDAAILQLGVQLPLEAEQNMALAAPVIRQIAGGVLHHPHPKIPKLLGVPVGDAAFPLVLGRRYVGPAGRAKWQVFDFHHNSLCRKQIYRQSAARLSVEDYPSSRRLAGMIGFRRASHLAGPLILPSNPTL